MIDVSKRKSPQRLLHREREREAGGSHRQPQHGVQGIGIGTACCCLRRGFLIIGPGYLEKEVAAGERAKMSSGEVNPAAVPVPVQDVQGDGRWMSQVWRELFSPLHAINFGIAGDTTCNVLWRLQNGELQNIKPKVVVLWVGTNNHEHTAEQVAGGILAIAQHLISCLPQAKIVVLGLLPRGERPNPLREKNAAVNGLLKAWLPRLGATQLLDASAGFVHSDGTISTGDMFDFLHLTASGYRTVAKPLSDLLLQLLEETPEERRASLV
ncbi:hypothetical protein JZ751_017091 [Albula glossodonta]|uniref:Platelet-activating factor acetylhydrolase IB subunit alpha2 n=1 Tax=Albula glossodonta TaxID=121402 RepID=A0A8T2NPU3_9TELE|nr:hypothetical protein JZ751_017091 [Albula glossodonta]